MDSSTSEPQIGRDHETLRAYWQQQGERGAQLESQRLQVSNFVIASSVVALGVISASEDPEARVVIGIGIAVALFNTMAAIYSWRSDQWSGLYKERAKQVLKENWN